MSTEVIAIDQHGCIQKQLGKYPRKELLRRYYTKHADKMYHDTSEGAKHVGYVVRGHWYRIYVGIEN